MGTRDGGGGRTHLERRRRGRRGESKGILGESRGGRTRRPEQQEQGENQFRNEKTSVGDLVVVEPEN